MKKKPSNVIQFPPTDIQETKGNKKDLALNQQSLDGDKFHYFKVPKFVARKVFEVDYDLLVSAVRSRIFLDDLIIFKLSGRHLFGNITHSKTGGWGVKEHFTGKNYSLEAVSAPQKVIGYRPKTRAAKRAAHS